MRRRSAFAELLIRVISDPGNSSRFMHNNAESALPIRRYSDWSPRREYRTAFSSSFLFGKHVKPAYVQELNTLTIRHFYSALYQEIKLEKTLHYITLGKKPEKIQRQ